MTAVPTNDGARQASVRAVTGTALDHDGDWHALFDLAGVGQGAFGGRMLAWINGQLGSGFLELNGAMNAYAASQGFAGWGAMGAFTAGGSRGSVLLMEGGGAVQAEAGGDVLTELQPVQTETGGAVLDEAGDDVLMG